MALPILNVLTQIAPQAMQGGAQGLPTMLAQLFPDMMALNKSGQPILPPGLLQALMAKGGLQEEMQNEGGEGQSNPNAYQLLATLLQTAQLLPPAALPVTDVAPQGDPAVDVEDIAAVGQNLPAILQVPLEQELPEIVPAQSALPELPEAETAQSVLPQNSSEPVVPSLTVAAPADDTPQLFTDPAVELPEVAKAVSTNVPVELEVFMVADETVPVPPADKTPAPAAIIPFSEMPILTDAQPASVAMQPVADKLVEKVDTSSPAQHPEKKSSPLTQLLNNITKLEERAQPESTVPEKPVVSKAVEALTAAVDQVQANRARAEAQHTEALLSRPVSSGHTQQSGGQQSGGQEKQDFGSALLHQWQSHGLHDATKPQHHDSAFSRLVEARDRTPLTDQVMVHIRQATQEGLSRITIQLDPPELGRLEVRMEVMADGKTGMVITAENKDALELLQKESRALERALSDAGLKTDNGSMSFNLRNPHQQNSQHFWGYQSSGYSAGQEVAEEEVVPAQPEHSVNYVLTMTSGLDIKV